jgi:hypothetical protein
LFAGNGWVVSGISVVGGVSLLSDSFCVIRSTVAFVARCSAYNCTQRLLGPLYYCRSIYRSRGRSAWPSPTASKFCLHRKAFLVDDVLPPAALECRCCIMGTSGSTVILLVVPNIDDCYAALAKFE